MTFEKLQEEFATMNIDERATWIKGGTNNKLFLNKAYEHLYDQYKNSKKFKKYFGLIKTKITFTGKIANLPVDFDCIDRVFTCDFDSDSDIYNGLENSGLNLYFNFEVRGQVATKTMAIEDDYQELWITYIPVRSDLSNNSDIPKIPLEIHRSIVDYAMCEYYRSERDWNNLSASITFADGKLKERMITIS